MRLFLCALCSLLPATLAGCDQAPTAAIDASDNLTGDAATDAATDAAIRLLDATPPPADAAEPDLTILDAMPPDGPPDRPDFSPDDCFALDDPRVDTDRDGMSDGEEQIAGTNPCDPDSDGDGIIDLAEVRYDGDPWDPLVGVDDYLVIPSDPGWVTLAVEFQLRLRQADIVFVLDSTGSMGGLLQGLAAGFAGLVAALAPAVPDAAYGIADYRDYVAQEFGGEGDFPFRLRQQLTTDVDRTQRALNALQASNGGDAPESTHEALLQALTGRGYDQGCDGRFDPGPDVLPFDSQPGDVFDGRVPGPLDESLPGSGKIGGVGFRQGAFKLIIYGTDAPLRDPGQGDASPGGCPPDATSAAVIAEARRIGVKLVGIILGGEETADGFGRMAHLARETGSFVMEAGAPRLLLLHWSGPAERELIGLISSLLGAVRFETVRAVVVEDAAGIAQGIVPPMVGPVEAADFARPQVFRLELDALGRQTAAWQVVTLGVALMADDGIELSRRWFRVAVPPRRR